MGEKSGFYPQIFKSLTHPGGTIEIFRETILKLTLPEPLQTGIFTVPRKS